MNHAVLMSLILTKIGYGTGQAKHMPFISPSTSESDIFKTFAPSGTGEFRTLVIANDKQTLLIGAEERVFGRRLSDVRRAAFSSVVWPASKKEACTGIPQSDRGTKCKNVIQVIHQLNDTHIVICGSNSMSPENKLLVRNDMKSNFDIRDRSFLQVPLCSYDQYDTVPSLHVRSDDDTSNFISMRKSLDSQPIIWKQTPDGINVHASNLMTGEFREYMAVFRAHDTFSQLATEKIYAVSEETAIEAGPGKVPKPTITQVCVNDIGGRNVLYKTWTSLLKVRVHCSTTDRYPLEFNRITDMVRGSGDLLYGTFVTTHETSRSNAICAFRLSDVQLAFRRNVFWDTMSRPLGRKSWKSLSPYYPGMCAHRGMDAKDIAKSTSKHFPNDFLNFMAYNPLMYGQVTPAFPSSDSSEIPWSKGPLLVKQGEKFRKIAVQQVADLTGAVHDVLYVGKDNGEILKLVSIGKTDVVETIELALYRPSADPSLSLVLSEENQSLYVGTKNAVHQLSTADCSSYTKSCDFCDPCSMCVLSRDPGCGWDTTIKQCVSIRNRNSTTIKQDVYYGNASTICDYAYKGNATIKTVSDNASVILGHVVRNPAVTALWWRYESSLKTRITDSATKYRINIDGRLQIINFDPAADSRVYECQYYAKSTAVRVSSYDSSPRKNDTATISNDPTISNHTLADSDLADSTLAGRTLADSAGSRHNEKKTIPGLTYAFVALLVVLIVLIALLCKMSKKNCRLPSHYRFRGLQSTDQCIEATVIRPNHITVTVAQRNSVENIDYCVPDAQHQCMTSYNSQASQISPRVTIRHIPPELPSRNTSLVPRQCIPQDIHSSLADSVSTLNSDGANISDGDSRYDVSVPGDKLHLYECVCEFSHTNATRQSHQYVPAYLTLCSRNSNAVSCSYDQLSFDEPVQRCIK